MRVQDQAAFILHHFPYRDTSQIIELFTRDYGRIAAVSRGSRSAKSKLKGVLQPFRYIQVSWSGKGELVSLNRAEESDIMMPLLTGNALPCGFYINEILMRLLHKHDVHEDIFNEYQQLLVSLTDQQNLEIKLRLFEKYLLQQLGFELNLSHEAGSQQTLDAHRQYFYYIEHGPVLAEQHTHSEHLVISGKSLLDFQQGDLSDEKVRREIKSLMRMVVAYYLGNKPLKSRELFR